MTVSDIFVSYVREREPFVRSLVPLLERHGLDVWVDVVGIAPGEAWRATVREAIVGSHTFVVVLDRGWLLSPVCGDELKLAVAHGKTIAPLVVPDYKAVTWKAAVAGVSVPDEIAARNYVWSSERPMDEVARDIAQIARTDFEWKRLWRSLDQRATQWDGLDRKAGLLRGRELARYREAIDAADGKEPRLNEIQRQFLKASQDAEVIDLEAQRRRADEAEAAALAAKSKLSSSERPRDALALAAQAWEIAPTLDALGALGAWFERHNTLIHTLRPVKHEIAALALSNAPYLAVGEALRAMVVGHRPSMRFVVLDPSSGENCGSLTDGMGSFTAAVWMNARVVLVVRNGVLIGYRVDPFRGLRQATRGVELPGPCDEIAMNPAGTHVAAACGYGGLVVQQVGVERPDGFYSGDLGLPLMSISDHPCERLAWLDDRRLLAVEDRGLVLRDIVDGTSRNVIPAASAIRAVDARDGSWVALAAGPTGRLFFGTGDERSADFLIDDPMFPTTIRWVPDRSAVLIGGGGGRTAGGGCVRWYQAADGSLRKEYPLIYGHERRVTAMAISSDGAYLVLGRDNGEVLVWAKDGCVLSGPLRSEVKVAPNKEKELNLRIEKQGFIDFLVIDDLNAWRVELPPDSDGTSSLFPVKHAVRDNIVAIGWSTAILWWSLSERVLVQKGDDHTNPVTALVASPTTTLWASRATSFRDNTLSEVKLWDVRSERPILSLDIPRPVDELAFDREGHTLLLLDKGSIVEQVEADPDLWAERARRMTR